MEERDEHWSAVDMYLHNALAGLGCPCVRTYIRYAAGRQTPPETPFTPFVLGFQAE